MTSNPNWKNEVGDWWLRTWPDGHHPLQVFSQCERCGETVASHDMGQHQQGAMCRSEAAKRSLAADGWRNAGTRANVFLRTGIRPVLVGGSWWVPGWAAIVFDSMTQWQGVRGTVVPAILAAVRDDPKWQRLVVAVAKPGSRGRLFVRPPAGLLSLLPIETTVAHTANDVRGYGLRAHYQWLKLLAEYEMLEPEVRRAAAERTFRIIQEVLHIEPALSTCLCGSMRAPERLMNQIRDATNV